MPVTPPSQLSPESQPWGRSVDARIEQVIFDAEKNQRDISLALASQSGTLNRLGDQITELNAVVTDLAATQATLASQQTQLTAQVAAIEALVTTQVDGITGTNSASPTLTTTVTGYAGINFTVPAGFTRAQVMAVSAMYAGGTVASILRTQINGVNGPDMYAFTNAAYANATASSAASISGLTGGANLNVQSVANTTTGTSAAVILTSAVITWLK